MNVWLFTRYLLGLLLWLPVTPAFAEATSTEIEFWQSVKDSGDAEMLEAYLQEFPAGEFTELANIKIRKLQNRQAQMPGDFPRTNTILSFLILS